MKANLTRHFRQRVVERMEGVDPLMLARGVVWAIDNARTDLVRYAHRVFRDGEMARVFRFDSLCGKRTFEVVMLERTTNFKFLTVYEVHDVKCR